MAGSLKIVKDTFSPRLKVINSELDPTSLKGLEKAHDTYKMIQYPLVPMSEQENTGHQGLLLSSMDKVRMLNFGSSIGLEFGFYANDESGNYAWLQETKFPNKHVRYAGHRPTIHYFERGIMLSQNKMVNIIRDEFKKILK